jgi:2-(1,2-epoxy-1,2-dihydrophenyl)acetyl-CoA isomerase
LPVNSQVAVELQDGVAVVTIDRPEAANSLDIGTARSLLDAVTAVAEDRHARCLLLRSTGDRFCVGGDVRGFAEAGGAADRHVGELAGTMHRAILVLARMDKPVVCLVQGATAGAGVGLAMTGDIVLASPEAHFTAAYTAIGLSPDCGLTWFLPRLIGARRASEMILTNRRVGAEEAVALGLVTRISEQLEEDGQAVACSLAGGATSALGSVRSLLHHSFDTALERQLEQELAAIQAASVSGEGQEGIAAFIGRRRADFRRN